MSTQKEIREWILSFKKVPCYDCGKEYPPVLMDFDHVPERGPKLFGISRMERQSKEKILEEIAKCDIVCPLCHRIRTTIRLGLITEDEVNLISKLQAKKEVGLCH